jgi:hypothetical protein
MMRDAVLESIGSIVVALRALDCLAKKSLPGLKRSMICFGRMARFGLDALND